jgi:hypothetical protein
MNSDYSVRLVELDHTIASDMTKREAHTLAYQTAIHQGYAAKVYRHSEAIGKAVFPASDKCSGFYDNLFTEGLPHV